MEHELSSINFKAQSALGHEVRRANSGMGTIENGYQEKLT